jgi:hypothetical protein
MIGERTAANAGGVSVFRRRLVLTTVSLVAVCGLAVGVALAMTGGTAAPSPAPNSALAYNTLGYVSSVRPLNAGEVRVDLRWLGHIGAAPTTGECWLGFEARDASRAIDRVWAVSVKSTGLAYVVVQATYGSPRPVYAYSYVDVRVPSGDARYTSVLRSNVIGQAGGPASCH